MGTERNAERSTENADAGEPSCTSLAEEQDEHEAYQGEYEPCERR
jgi:hypothetical protein